MRGVPALAALVITSLVLAGCTLPQGAPEERIQAAVERFPSDLDSGGSITEMAGTATMTSTEDFGFGGPIDIVFTFGSNDVTRFTVTAQGFIITAYCSPDTIAFQAFTGYYESRAGEEGCGMDGQEFEVPLEDQPDFEIVSYEEGDDGSLTAEIRITEADDEGGSESHTGSDEEGSYEAHDVDDELYPDDLTLFLTIDAKDRITGMSFDTNEGTFELDVEYGQREAITIPDGATRMPASVLWAGDIDDNTYRGTVEDAEGDLPSSEFQFWVRDRETGDALAQFDLDDGATQTDGGFTFTWTDDGDGMLSEGDSFVVSAASWTYSDPYEPIFYDRWAETTVDGADIPAPAIGLVIAAIGALLVASRRHP